MRFKGYIPVLLLVILILSIPIVSSFTFDQKINNVTQTITNVPYYYVDNNLSNVDSSGDKGTHSNFTAQQYGPDSIYDNLSEGAAEEANWLSGWQKRIRVEVDHNDINDALSDFPVLVYLSNSSGRNSDDVSCVFDELQSDANRKKIAVTASDGITQCYVEIEKWDNASEEAWLWVKVPSISSTVDTDLYLYYDSDHADNTTYVGDPNSTPAENVWDSNHKGVWHLTEDASGTGTTDLYKDSTSNNNDGDDYVSATGKTGKINDGQEFDGSDDYVDCGNDTSADVTGNITLEAWIYPHSLSTYQEFISKGEYADPPQLFTYFILIMNTGYVRFGINVGGAGDYVDSGSALPSIDQWYHVAATLDPGSNDVVIYIDGSQSNTGTITNDPPSEAEYPLYIGALKNGAGTLNQFNGIIDEVRISSTARSAAWIKASYESERDDLLDFGSEESLTYELDLEVQWTNVDYSEANEELCVYGGFMNDEDIRVDVWNGSSWENLFDDLNPGWNNVTVTSYLISSTLTIRFKGATETNDSIQDSWAIGATLLHVWS